MPSSRQPSVTGRPRLRNTVLSICSDTSVGRNDVCLECVTCGREARRFRSINESSCDHDVVARLLARK